VWRLSCGKRILINKVAIFNLVIINPLSEIETPLDAGRCYVTRVRSVASWKRESSQRLLKRVPEFWDVWLA
jgi:hypothetical protein